MLIFSEKLFTFEDDMIELAYNVDNKTYSLKDIWNILSLNPSTINDLNLQILDFLNALFLFNRYDISKNKLIKKVKLIENYCNKQISIRINRIKQNNKQLCLIQFLLILCNVIRIWMILK